MIKIGLTGPSGAGKGALSQILEKHGIPCLDTDKVSREVCGAGMPCTLELARAFGEDVIDENGNLLRRELASKVFLASDRDEKTRLLNLITHRYILKEADRWLDEQEKLGYTAAVVDAPVLFEAGYDKKCDYTIGVLADPAVRLSRITERDGIDSELALKRIESQKDDEFFISHCSLVLYNDNDIASLEAQALPYIEKLLRGVLPE